MFEGGEGSGKSTQAALLARELGAVLTREPGGTDLGRLIRELVLDPRNGPVDMRAEALLLAADRAQHVARVVRPSLERGTDVVSDRFAGSTLAYQGWGRGLDVGWLRELSAWASRGTEPDVVVLLDLEPGTAAARRAGTTDRMEAAGPDFHLRVAQGYRTLAHAEPDRWVVVDAGPPVDEVARSVREAVWPRLSGAS